MYYKRGTSSPETKYGLQTSLSGLQGFTQAPPLIGFALCPLQVLLLGWNGSLKCHDAPCLPEKKVEKLRVCRNLCLLSGWNVGDLFCPTYFCFGPNQPQVPGNYP